MEISWLQIAVIAVLLLIPILYECNKTVHFYAKYIAYQVMILGVGLITIPPSLRRPGDVTNQSWASWATKTFVKPMFGIRISVEDAENLKSDTPYIAICNHQTFIDFVGMMEIYPERCTALAKRSLLYTGTFGLGMWLSGIIFIDRHRPDRAKETINKTVEIMNRKNAKVWIFPEGTRNPHGGLLSFKKGAFHLAVQGQVPLVPIVFSNYSEYFSQKEKKFTNNLKFTIKVLPPIPTKGLTVSDVPELLEKTRQSMLDTYNEISRKDKGLNVPSSDK
ncbi:1-acyl-sn-glycerol-3-phosphate acyltransferase alpha-like [Ptychodera flava]|uniref:1-acyl-sn-glycerol-3-phosphate acyltransferase alpha-like n=1 Tax=Ptychodera flava TaxID=63121 RepID=UPI003969D709